MWMESRVKKVAQISPDGNIVKIWISGANAERNSIFSKKNISACCLKSKKSHLGFYWMFASELDASELLNMRVEIKYKSKRIKP